MPLWGALLGIWNRNFLHQSSLAIIPYSSGLDFWTEHLQQLFMESNGKSIAQDGGTLLDYSTVPIIWGSVGTEGQHAYYQAIHQGTDSIPLEFIAFLDSQMNRDGESNGSTNQEKLLASALAQMLALAIGSQDENPNKMCRGNRPSHLLIANKLNPYSLGELLAYHEHYVAFQGFLWGINSFDQEGVQLGKKLTQQLLNIWRSHKPSLKSDQDICAKTLIDEVQKMKKKCSRCE